MITVVVAEYRLDRLFSEDLCRFHHEGSDREIVSPVNSIYFVKVTAGDKFGRLCRLETIPLWSQQLRSRAPWSEWNGPHRTSIQSLSAGSVCLSWWKLKMNPEQSPFFFFPIVVRAQFTVVGSFSTSVFFQVTFNSNGCVWDPTDTDRYCAPAETRITDWVIVMLSISFRYHPKECSYGTISFEPKFKLVQLSTYCYKAIIKSRIT